LQCPGIFSRRRRHGDTDAIRETRRRHSWRSISSWTTRIELRSLATADRTTDWDMPRNCAAWPPEDPALQRDAAPECGPKCQPPLPWIATPPHSPQIASDSPFRAVEAELQQFAMDPGRSHSAFSCAKRRISPRISTVIFGRPPRARERRRQKSRKPAWCQLMTASGFTMTRTSAQRGQQRRRTVQKNLSSRFKMGRARLRLTTATCGRSARTQGRYHSDCERKLGALKGKRGWIGTRTCLALLFNTTQRSFSRRDTASQVPDFTARYSIVYGQRLPWREDRTKFANAS
jgi:hypothetical protein